MPMSTQKMAKNPKELKKEKRKQKLKNKNKKIKNV